jgi:hypothetical protein
MTCRFHGGRYVERCIHEPTQCFDQDEMIAKGRLKIANTQIDSMTNERPNNPPEPPIAPLVPNSRLTELAVRLSFGRSISKE